MQVIAMAVVWCTRKALDVRPSWNSDCLSRLSGFTATDVYCCFAALYKVYDPHYDEVKMRCEITDSRNEK
jgi:hypothetical protein